MDWLKTILGEAGTEETIEAIKKELPKHFKPSSEFNRRGDEIKALNDQLGTMGTQIEGLKSQTGIADELKAKLESVTGEFETFKNNASKRESNYAKKDVLKKRLSKEFNEDAVDLLIGTFDLDALTSNEAGEIVDIDSKISGLKEARPNLVKTQVPETPPPVDRETPPAVDYSKMSDSEYYAAKAAEQKGS